MPKTRLSPNEIDELILSYNSAKSKLLFQLSKIDETIYDLEIQKSGISKKSSSKTPVKAPSRAKKAPGRVTKSKGGATAGKRVRKVSSGGYKLSEWDEFLISTINNKGYPLINSELLAACKVMADEKKLKLTEDQIQGKIARCLHKMSNKRNILRKLNIEGRGFAYGLGGWFFTKSGKLKKAYAKKLSAVK